MLGFAVRLRTSVLKLAMTFRASACAFDPSADPLVIDEAAVRAAIGYVRLAWGNVLHIFDEEFAPDRDARMRRSILEKIGHGCSRSELLRRTHMRARDLDAWLDTMIEAEEIQKERTYTAQVGLTRQRNRELVWYAPGPNHPAAVARRRARPKKAWEKEWDEAVAKETPLVLSGEPPNPPGPAALNDPLVTLPDRPAAPMAA
jgi:hypothetical protein